MINLFNKKRSNEHINLFSSKLKENIIKKAASMLVKHLNVEKPFLLPNLQQNTNANAFDEHRYIHRTKKCNSWLSKLPTQSDTSINQALLRFPESSSYKPKLHVNQLTLSSNAISQEEPFSQPLIMIHKKRLRRDYFLSSMQNCVQPPYSPNHFYAFDQFNFLKLQQSFCENKSKRKYSDIYEDNDDDREFEYISSEKMRSPPKTADHISINKYHDDVDIPFNSETKFDVDNQQQEQEQSSQIILSHLEKILNLCGDLRRLAHDVENHLHHKQINASDTNEKEASEQNIIDIYNEIENEQIDEENEPPPYDTSSIHSDSIQSHTLMQTESFKTKSPSLSSSSHTKLPKPEDICSCFLKSLFDKENCELNSTEQEYLNQLTKAYLLGREQLLKEQHEENNKFQVFLNESLPNEQNASSLTYDTNNNNQLSSILFYNNLQNSTENLSLTESKMNILNPLSDVITHKHELFLHEPIANKLTNVLPGIGRKYAQQLEECGFSTVRRLLGFYLMIKDDQHFVNWLNNKPQISTHSAWLCTNALRAWCQEHL